MRMSEGDPIHQYMCNFAEAESDLSEDSSWIMTLVSLTKLFEKLIINFESRGDFPKKETSLQIYANGQRAQGHGESDKPTAESSNTQSDEKAKNYVTDSEYASAGEEEVGKEHLIVNYNFGYNILLFA
uniref:Uncharacterized protein n=1 Tax=Glossina pallidipes TaxID=7398 RepID=A0A1A9ZPV5_GLOPL